MCVQVIFLKQLLIGRLLKVQLLRASSLVTEGGGCSFIERGKRVLTSVLEIIPEKMEKQMLLLLPGKK